REQGLRAELLADLVSCAATLDPMTKDRIRKLAAQKLSVLPNAGLQSAEVDPVVIAVAARALQVEAARWARLRVGEELSYDWPGRKSAERADRVPPSHTAPVPAPRRSST